MAKISVSIPDELKEQLDTYALQTGFKRSAAVAHILEAFFADEVRRPGDVSPEQVSEIDQDLDEVQAYLAQLHEQNPDLFPKPDWVEKPKRRRQSMAATFGKSLGL